MQPTWEDRLDMLTATLKGPLHEQHGASAELVKWIFISIRDKFAAYYRCAALISQYL